MKISILATMLAFGMAWAVVLPRDGTTSPVDNSADVIPTTSPNNASTFDVAQTALGINCHGSAFCFSCSRLKEVMVHLDKIPDNVMYKEGEKIACTRCDFLGLGWQGVCIFTQKTRGREISGKVVKAKVRELEAVKHCPWCGSIPLYTPDVNDGEVTVNYVRKGCGNRVCRS
ncbi:Kp4-domain-containing protein [Massariosphaeria phaeospora]|uniref:Kp4-domain-containing protein n=1 Tax=Massariosphaeria phaeospora TaxID=100035 RepID=A0A7C8M9S2_9PLEO|nr:Kp4-domain-containing protein [Massariosphaeria phaeospora]